jgi:arylformamidase
MAGDTPYACRWASLIAKGESVNVSAVIGSPHVGTHADAPLHVHDGWPGSHELPLDAFRGSGERRRREHPDWRHRG